ncbi:MAG: hypothetical protein HYZ19_00230 [Rhodocyclales bacterium]|nr:hypothetical protein [Rhodocyclales bacterium]
MSKLILLLLLGLLAYLVLKALKRSGERRDAKRPNQPSAERMVACARCGVHLPESEAVESAGRHYCCEEHRRMAE